MGTIILLTLKEAMRRRAFLGTILILVVLYGLSFLPKAFHEAFGGSERRFEMGLQLMVSFGVDSIKFFSSVLAIVLCAGTLTGEIERGYLSAILPRPIYRWQVYLGKWLGVMFFCLANAVLWTAMLWVSVFLQGKVHYEMWFALPYVLLYPMLYGTLALVFSSFAGTAVSLMLTVAMGALAYFSDHILRPLAGFFDVVILQRIVWFSEWVVPMAVLKRFVAVYTRPNFTGRMEEMPFGSEEVRLFLNPPAREWELGYVLVYIGLTLLIGGILFQRRDVQ
ncbi:MAG: hypothetical protein C4337_02375 [Armatimonadota bacterium]